MSYDRLFSRFGEYTIDMPEGGLKPKKRDIEELIDNSHDEETQSKHHASSKGKLKKDINDLVEQGSLYYSKYAPIADLM